jgi:RNA polymerase sigma factor (sigma-70 family)
MNHVMRYLRKVALREGRDSPSDGQLLEDFLRKRDEAAFETLLRRHGPMVLGVCRRTLHNAHDAEDAFQATFLVLVRKASTIRPREMVGNWLYGVACRTAMKARAMNTKRRIRESQAAGMGRPEDPATPTHEEMLKHLDAEVSRLPDKYRLPLVLCELQGKSRKEAARLLGLPEGTLSWRLAWARKTLARRLSRHGAPLSAGALTAALSCDAASAGVPAALLNLTARTALQVAAGRTLTAGAVSAQVVTLTEGVLKAMLLSKLKVLWPVVLLVAIGAGATGLAYRAAAADPAQPRDAQPRVRLAFDELEELRLEVAALRKGLESTRERVKSLESEVNALKQPRLPPARSTGGSSLGPSSFGALGTTGGALGFSGGGGLAGNLGQSSSGGFAGGGLAGNLGQSSSGGFSGGTAFSRSNTDKLNSIIRTEMSKRRSEQAESKAKQDQDPLANAEKAIKELRQHPDNKQAAEQLERAVQWLKQRSKPKNNAVN